MEYNDIIQSVDRLTSWMNRMKWICHLALLVPSTGLFFISLALCIPMQLIVARFLQYYGFGLVEFSLLFLMALSFAIPHICLWTFRRRKYLLCALILAAVVLDAAALLAHAEYCRWSTRKVGSFYNQSITVDELYRECHHPLAYREYKGNTIAIYGDGSSVYFVFLDESGIIKQMPMGSLWMD